MVYRHPQGHSGSVVNKGDWPWHRARRMEVAVGEVEHAYGIERVAKAERGGAGLTNKMAGGRVAPSLAGWLGPAGTRSA